ncbi:pirin family protein [Pontibaca methylaminivorans]|uniref:pirin family protein n=1 Tax=Pontibaca methylaminivorans TaxID=515897 RepID=UPI002FD8D8F8
MKKILGIHDAPRGHWVGDGFPVRSLFSYQSHGAQMSPFLLLDHAGPAHFEPAQTPRGVGAHPHRGFETVTIVYDGEVEHRDSTGAGGKIGPGDVQWMTAASGILHEEFHSHDYTRRGGPFEMVQLWVNLPAADKMAAPHYQLLENGSIPSVPLPDDGGTVRVIAGEYGGARGPARTHTPLNVWDLRVAAGKSAAFDLPEGHTLAVVVLAGRLQVNAGDPVQDGQMVVLDRAGTGLVLSAESDARLLLLGGEPINEPIAGHGPFVMNTQEEIRQAFADFRSGRFGRIAA